MSYKTLDVLPTPTRKATKPHSEAPTHSSAITFIRRQMAQRAGPAFTVEEDTDPTIIRDLLDSPLFGNSAIESAETMKSPRFTIAPIDPENPEQVSSLLKLRNGALIPAYDIICAALEERGIIDSGDHGRHKIESYGGLGGQMSRKDMETLINNQPPLIVTDKENRVKGAYLVSSNFSNNQLNPTPDEEVALGTSQATCLKLLQNTIGLDSNHFTPRQIEDAKQLRQIAIEAIYKKRLVGTPALITSHLFRKQGMATILKYLTFKRLIEQGKKFAFIRIFEITGLYQTLSIRDTLKTWHSFSDSEQGSIKNTGSFHLNAELGHLMGKYPVYSPLASLITDHKELNRTNAALQEDPSAPPVSELFVETHYNIFLSDLELAAKKLKAKIDAKQLTHRFKIEE